MLMLWGGIFTVSIHISIPRPCTPTTEYGYEYGYRHLTTLMWLVMDGSYTLAAGASKVRDTVDCRCVGYACKVVCHGVATNIYAACLSSPLHTHTHTGKTFSLRSYLPRARTHPPAHPPTYPPTHTHHTPAPAALGCARMKLRADRRAVESASAWRGSVVLAKWRWDADPADSHVELRFCIYIVVHCAFALCIFEYNTKLYLEMV